MLGAKARGCVWGKGKHLAHWKSTEGTPTTLCKKKFEPCEAISAIWTHSQCNLSAFVTLILIRKIIKIVIWIELRRFYDCGLLGGGDVVFPIKYVKLCINELSF